MGLPGGQQIRQPAPRAQAAGQVVVRQRGAHLVMRLVDERPGPPDVQRAKQPGRLLARPERQQRRVRGQHVPGHVDQLGGHRIDPELGDARHVDTERSAPLGASAGLQAGRDGERGADLLQARAGALARVLVHLVPGLEARRRKSAARHRAPPRPGWCSLLTVPVTVTVAPGWAVCGLIESMTIDTRPAAPDPPAPGCLGRLHGLACAGAASASTAVTAAGMATAAARDRTRLEMSAVSKPCTLGMLLPIETGPVLCRYPQCPCP